MKIVCPSCGESIETEVDVAVGQHVICPACDQKFTYGGEAEYPSSDAKAGESSAPTNAIAIKCPHCGTEYEADRSDFGRFVACEECGEGFVVGQTGERKDDEPVKEQGKIRKAVSSAGSLGKSVAESVGKVDWKKHWQQAQRTTEEAAKAVKGKLDEVDWEKHREQVRDVAQNGVAFGREGLRKAQGTAWTFWRNWLAAPTVVRIVCCLLMAKGVGALCNLHHMSDLCGGMIRLPAFIVNMTFTAIGAMVWGELISTVVYLFVFPYELLQKRRWVGKAVGFTFLIIQLMYFVEMIAFLEFNVKLMRQVLFSWENICLIVALIMMFKVMAMREWLGLGAADEPPKVRIPALVQTKRFLIGSLILLGLCVAGTIAFSIASDHESRRLESAIYAAVDGRVFCDKDYYSFTLRRELPCGYVPIKSIRCEKDNDCGFDDIWNVTLTGECSRHGVVIGHKRFRLANGRVEPIGR